MKHKTIKETVIFSLLFGLAIAPKSWAATDEESLRQFVQKFGPAIKMVKGVVGTRISVDSGKKGFYKSPQPHQVDFVIYVDGTRSQEQIKASLIEQVPEIKRFPFTIEDTTGIFRPGSKAVKIQGVPTATGAQYQAKLASLKRVQGGKDLSKAGQLESKTFDGMTAAGKKDLPTGIPASFLPGYHRPAKGFVASAVPGAFHKVGLYKSGAPVAVVRPQEKDSLEAWKQDMKRQHSEMRTQAHVASGVFYTGILAIFGSLIASMLTMNPMIFAAGLAGGLGIIGSGVITVPRLAKWWHARQEAKRAAKGLPSLVEVRHEKLNRKPLPPWS